MLLEENSACVLDAEDAAIETPCCGPGELPDDLDETDEDAMLSTGPRQWF